MNDEVMNISLPPDLVHQPPQPTVTLDICELASLEMIRAWTGQLLVDQFNQSHREYRFEEFFEKVLDRIAFDTLYKTIRATPLIAHCEEVNSMLMSRIRNEHSTKWQPCAAMYAVVCSTSLSLSATNSFGGRLERQTSIDSRQIRQ